MLLLKLTNSLGQMLCFRRLELKEYQSIEYKREVENFTLVHSTLNFHLFDVLHFHLRNGPQTWQV